MSYTVIRNPNSGLVLDATQYEVKLQHYTRFPTQLWKLEGTHDGKFIIVNKSNGKVLDIQGGANKCSAYIITYQKHGGVNQKWYVNSDGTIVSAASGNLALDICEAKLCAGTNLIAFTKHGGQNQKFLIQF